VCSSLGFRDLAFCGLHLKISVDECRLECSIILVVWGIFVAALMGRRYFPSFSAVIDEYVLDDDLMDLVDEGNIDEEAQLLKKRHFAELKGLLQDSFPEGEVRNDNSHKMRKEVLKKQPRKMLDEVPSSSSSTSTSRGTGGSMVTTSSQ